jgi:glutathione S-transferase
LTRQSIPFEKSFFEMDARIKSGHDGRDKTQQETQVLKIWGRKTSSNVQKAMWAVGELNLPHERIDVGGSFGGTKDARYLAMNPNSLVPTLEEDDFILWESNSIVRYLAAKHGGVLQPSDPQAVARANQWMDWQLSVVGPAIRDAFWGLIRTPEAERDHAAIAKSQAATTDAMRILDGALGKSAYVAGDKFSMGDIPVGVMAYRFFQLVPDRPKLANLERWYAAIEQRQAFKDHVGAVPLT